MNVEQSMRFTAAFAREAAKSPSSGLCGACVDVLDVSGAGISIMGGGQSGPVAVSNPSIAALEDLQFTVGQGPCPDAFRTVAPVHAPYMDLDASMRWPSFVELAELFGFGSVFAYPLTTGGEPIGVLALYRHESGDLSTAQHDDSVAMADVVTKAVLSMQETAAFGTLAAGLDDAIAYRAEVHQASGMVAIQLQVSVAEALVRIRGHAFASSEPIGEVARSIVAGRLRLDDDRIPRQERT